MSYINELKEEIENTREKMYRAYENNPMDPQVLVISQELDKLLNEFDFYLKSDWTSKNSF
ncbi:Spo0E family sporulation regulatory protein-aspartic acid phosphatase [Virgibacillus flavescens]|uniref:Spo0E family sporulation regulatory protein-aspartic acid phosphatase n=1 Tax=Virgibacillus flavescens TaxID=1611422 RepID=UPI003D328F3C